MAILLHSFSARHLRGALLLATATGATAAVLLRDRLDHEILVAIAWDAAVLAFLVVMVAVTSRYDESVMAKKVRHRAPSSLMVGATALGSALFGIYAIALLLSATGDDGRLRALHIGVGLATTILSWALVHLLFALEYAKLFYVGGPADGPPPGGLDFPGGHPPDYADFLYFSFIIGVACQTADVAITGRRMRRMSLLHGLIAFLFNTVILAATINVAAGLG
jgi:uncharacterized membrane protein